MSDFLETTTPRSRQMLLQALQYQQRPVTGGNPLEGVSNAGSQILNALVAKKLMQKDDAEMADKKYAAGQLNAGTFDAQPAGLDPKTGITWDAARPEDAQYKDQLLGRAVGPEQVLLMRAQKDAAANAPYNLGPNEQRFQNGKVVASNVLPAKPTGAASPIGQIQQDVKDGFITADQGNKAIAKALMGDKAPPETWSNASPDDMRAAGYPPGTVGRKSSNGKYEVTYSPPAPPAGFQSAPSGAVPAAGGGPAPAMSFIPGGPEDPAFKAAAAATEAKVKRKDSLPKVQGAYNQTVSELDKTLSLIDELTAVDPKTGKLVNDEGMGDVTGFGGNVVGDLLTSAGSKGAGVRAKVERLKARAFLGGLQALKESSPSGASGLGALSETEGKKTEASAAALDRRMSQEDFVKALTDYKKDIQGTRNNLTNSFQQEYGEFLPKPDASAVTVKVWNPATKKFEGS